MRKLSVFLAVVVVMCGVVPAFAYIPSAKLKAAQNGDVKAQCEIGLGYAKGWITGSPDYVEAVKWWRKAAEQGYAEGQYNLGVSYAFGAGVKQDYVEAVRLWTKAAEQNYAQAQHNLGVAYENGYGVRQDKAEAVKWYRKAARQGHYESKSALKYLGETW